MANAGVQSEVLIALTVRTLREWLPLSEAALVAGAAGLEREVSWPTTLRARPPGFEPLSGQELALVSVGTLRALDGTLSLAQVIGRLADRGVAALIVAGEVSAAAIDEADRRGLPLFRVPAPTNLHEFEQAVGRVIVEERTRLYQRGLEIHHQLVEVAIAGRGLPAIVRRLGDLTGRMVVFQDQGGAVEAFSVPPGQSIDLAWAIERLPDARLLASISSQRAPSSPEPPVTRLPLADADALITPVVARSRPIGYLLMIAPADDWREDDRLALARGSAVCALELVKQEAVIEAERRLRGDFFDDLLTPTSESSDSLMSRARHLGFDLLKAHVAILIAPERSNGRGQLLDGSVVDEVSRAIAHYLAERQIMAPLVVRRTNVLLLYPIENASDLAPARRAAEEIRAHLGQAHAGVVLLIGIGRCHPGVSGIRSSFAEAEQALQIGRQLFGTDQVTCFTDLGVYRLLYAFRQSPDLASFCTETLAILSEYDAKNGTELIRTLETFFACNGSLRAAAEDLYLHRNSLAYRLRRVSELTGLNLDNFEDCFRLQLALKARHLIRTVPNTPRAAMS